VSILYAADSIDERRSNIDSGRLYNAPQGSAIGSRGQYMVIRNANDFDLIANNPGKRDDARIDVSTTIIIYVKITQELACALILNRLHRYPRIHNTD
jgi:hypothetical protein